jgi:nicotinic acid mononucleotide adenylyltransferase
MKTNIEQTVYDLKRLFILREALETLELAAPPTARILSSGFPPLVRRVGILCGSFNPLTLAHTELADRASETFGLDRVLFTLAKVTVDKEQVTGLGLEDRLLLLSLYAERHDSIGVALVNRGLYVDQAQAFRSLLGPHVELQFIVGMDKLVQILDPRYYQDREAALRQLFALSSLIVANRPESSCCFQWNAWTTARSRSSA